MQKLFAAACAIMGVLIVSQLTNAGKGEATSVLLRVTGDVTNPLSLTAADIDSLPRYEVTAVIHERSVSYRGIALRDVLHRAGPPEGIDVARAIVIARARDGYEAVYALVELEEDFTDKLIIAADERDGEALPEKEGPLRSVVEGEKLATRSVRQLTELEVRLIRSE